MNFDLVVTIVTILTLICWLIGVILHKRVEHNEHYNRSTLVLGRCALIFMSSSTILLIILMILFTIKCY